MDKRIKTLGIGLGAVIIIFLFAYLFYSPSTQFLERKSALKDSIVNIQNGLEFNDTLYKSTAHVVYGDVRFGMTEKEYNQIIKESSNMIGNNMYFFKPLFTDNNKLYALDIKSPSKSANYIDTDLQEYLENLNTVITHKYKTPSFSEPISFFDFKPGYIRWQYGWNLFTKRIRIGIGENQSGSTYYTIMRIYDKNMMDEIEKSAEDLTNSEQINDSNKF